MREANHRIKTVAELRGKQAVNGLFIFTLTLVAGKAKGIFSHISGARIGGHDQNHIAEINGFAITICELAVIHHLQQNII